MTDELDVMEGELVPYAVTNREAQLAELAAEELTPHTQRKIREEVDAGQPYFVAAGIAGVSAKAVGYALQHGELNPRGPYGTFYRSCARARANHLKEMWTIKQEHLKDPKNKAWQDFYRYMEVLEKDSAIMNGDGRHGVQVNIANFTDVQKQLAGRNANSGD